MNNLIQNPFLKYLPQSESNSSVELHTLPDVSTLICKHGQNVSVSTEANLGMYLLKRIQARQTFITY